MFHYDFHSDFTARDNEDDRPLSDSIFEGGNDWSATVKEACFSVGDRSVEKSSTHHLWVLGAALGTLALLGVALWPSAPQTARFAKKVGLNSIDKLAWVKFVLDDDRL